MDQQTPKMPDVTPVQIIAQIPALVALAVSFGWVDGTAAQGIISAAGVLITVVWMLADVFIRRGRANVFASQAYAPAFAAAKIAEGGSTPNAADAAADTAVAPPVAPAAEVSEIPAGGEVEADLPPADGAGV